MSSKPLTGLCGLSVFLAILAVCLSIGYAQPLLILDCSDGPAPIDGHGVAESRYDCGETGGSYTYDLFSSPMTLNPITAQYIASNAISDHVFGGGTFTKFNNLGRGATGLSPQVASQIGVSEDGNSIIYTLRDFNFGKLDGTAEPVTINDIVYTYYGVIWNPNLPNDQSRNLTCPTDGSPFQLEVLSERQVKISCPEPFRTFSIKASSFLVLSSKMIEELIDDQDIRTELAIHPGPDGVLDTEQLGDDERVGPIMLAGRDGVLPDPSGDDVQFSISEREFLGLNTDLNLIRATGPFLLNFFNSQALATYERNPEFYEVDSNGIQLPYLDEVRIIIYPNAAHYYARVANFLNGETDAINLVPTEVALVLSKASAGGFAVNVDSINNGTPVSGTSFTTPNWDDPNPNLAAAFRNQTVRQAISLVIDRARIVNGSYLGMATPQYIPSSLAGAARQIFHSGRENTCDKLEAVFPSEVGHCDRATGIWTAGSLTVNVTALPDLSLEHARRYIGCLIDYADCVEQAESLLDSVGILDSDDDGIREIPQNFDPVVANRGGDFWLAINTNFGGAIDREETNEIICDNLTAIGIRCSVGLISFPLLVNQLYAGTFTGLLTIGLTASDPGTGPYDEVEPCLGNLHFWHQSCDESQSNNLAMPLPEELALAEAWQTGYEAVSVEDAQAAFDRWQELFLEVQPYFHTAIYNSLFATRTDRFHLGNMGRSVYGGIEFKFRIDN